MPNICWFKNDHGKVKNLLSKFKPASAESSSSLSSSSLSGNKILRSEVDDGEDDVDDESDVASSADDEPVVLKR